MATMPTDTATIRVARNTRDLLAEQAQDRGVSLASLLAEIARERQTAAIWHSEREASRIDGENPDVADEDRAWEAVLADGFQ
jgi:hypothetical protein